MIVQKYPGTPCRLSLEDTPVGESELLLNYQQLPEVSPYRASHAIFVREQATDASPDVNEVPASMRNRMLSIRAFDDRHHIIDADVIHGVEFEQMVYRLLVIRGATYLHVHNAKPGCFAARIDRVGKTLLVLPLLSSATKRR